MAMREGIQTNFENVELRTWGCYFFSLLKMAEQTQDYFDYTDKAIIQLFNECKDLGIIGDKAYIVNPIAVLNHCLSNEFQPKFKEVKHSNIKPHIAIFPMFLKKPGQANSGHFILNINGKTWDSLDPSRAAAREYIISHYVVIV